MFTTRGDHIVPRLWRGLAEAPCPSVDESVAGWINGLEPSPSLLILTTPSYDGTKYLSSI